jgi:predicted transcriptional regulator
MTPAYVLAAAQLYTLRRARDEVFGFDREGFGEPGWDMLLTIVVRNELSVEDLIFAAAAPVPIATTYLDWLVSRELVARTERETVVLAERGRALMVQYLDREMRAKL